jgi:hypothetical protein
MTQKIAKRHHYLPQFYLKGFTSKTELKKKATHHFVWVYDKLENKWREAETKSAFVEKDLYTLNESFASSHKRIGTVDKAEKLFAEGLEIDFSNLLNRIIETPHIPDKNTEDYSILIGFLGLQYVRTPERIEELKEYKLTNSNEICGLPIVEMNQLKDFYIEQIQNFSWKIGVIEPESEDVFITSDYPCIEYRDTYFALENRQPALLELYFPLSSKLILVGKKESNEAPQVVIANKEDINTYNQEIYSKAKRFVASSKRLTLQV